MEKTILVVGATGLLGEPVARRLKENGLRVRVMSRDTNKARKMFDESFEVVVGDVMDKNSLGKPLEGCFGVHINLTGYEERIGVENISSVASQKGLERITYTSGTNTFEENAWFPLTRMKLAAETVIYESGIPHTIFCPTWAMESLTRFIRGNSASVIGKQPNPFHWMAADDYGRMVSGSYLLKEASNKKFFIHGPESILTHEALRRYCSVLHPEIKKISTMPHWLANIIATIIRNKEMKFACDVLGFFEKVGEAGDPTEANSILGAPEITLDEWLKQRKAKSGESSAG